jgi:hypothetical protein
MFANVQLGDKRFLAGGLFQKVTNVPGWSSLWIHIMKGCSPLLMTAPQVEAPACPTQGKNLKPIYMGPLQDTKKSHQLWNSPGIFMNAPKLVG